MLDAAVASAGPVEVAKDVGGTLGEYDPSVITWLGGAGTALVIVAMSCCISLRPRVHSGSR